MESVRKRIKMELVCSERRFEKLINKPTFKHTTIYNDNVVAVTLENNIIKFDKPIYIGKHSNRKYYFHLIYYNVLRIFCTRCIQDAYV